MAIHLGVYDVTVAESYREDVLGFALNCKNHAHMQLATPDKQRNTSHIDRVFNLTDSYRYLFY